MLCGNFVVYPGSMGLVGMAVDLFGGKHVDPRSWATSVYLKNISVKEARAFLELAREYDPSLKMRVAHYSVLVSTSCHGMSCVEVSGAPLEVMRELTAAICENRVGEKAYKTRCAAGAFLQGKDTLRGWILIEFWKPNYMPFVEYLNERLKKTRPCGD